MYIMSQGTGALRSDIQIPTEMSLSAIKIAPIKDHSSTSIHNWLFVIYSQSYCFGFVTEILRNWTQILLF